MTEISIASSIPAPEATPLESRSADQFAWLAARVLGHEGRDALAQFDPHPAPLYALDAGGGLIYYNDACVTLAGRTPQLGVDRYWVCPALFTPDGKPLDEATGAMAAVLNEARPLRDLDVLMEQPGGERIAVRPYPTPALDPDGRLVGAVNVVVPLDGVLHRDLAATAARCRTLAKWIGDPQANVALIKMADDCDRQAQILRPD